MFKSTNEHDRFARAVGRIVFGVVLILGAAVLVERVVTVRDPHAAAVIGITWAAAFAAAFASWQLTRAMRFNRPFDLPTSFAVPAIGIALLLPLTLHLPVTALLGWSAGDFDDWVRLSLAITGSAHVIFAILAAARAVQLADGRTPITTTKIYVVTLAVSCIPFAFLYFIPPILVGLTGIAIAPLLHRMPKLIDRELAPTLPSAVALTL